MMPSNLQERENVLCEESQDATVLEKETKLVEKGNQLARLCHADVTLIIRRNERYYTYRSIDHERWPSSMSEVVRIHLRYRSYAI